MAALGAPACAARRGENRRRAPAAAMLPSSQPTVSRHHLELRARRRVVDLGSSNGTWPWAPRRARARDPRRGEPSWRPPVVSGQHGWVRPRGSASPVGRAGGGTAPPVAGGAHEPARRRTPRCSLTPAADAATAAGQVTRRRRRAQRREGGGGRRAALASPSPVAGPQSETPARGVDERRCHGSSNIAKTRGDAKAVGTSRSAPARSTRARRGGQPTAPSCR